VEGHRSPLLTGQCGLEPLKIIESIPVFSVHLHVFRVILLLRRNGLMVLVVKLPSFLLPALISTGDCSRSPLPLSEHGNPLDHVSPRQHMWQRVRKRLVRDDGICRDRNYKHSLSASQF